MECSKFLIESIYGNNPLNNGFFIVGDREKQCYKCKEYFFALHHTLSRKMWCVECYVEKYCRIVHHKDGFIIQHKITNRILYNNTLSLSQEVENATFQELVEQIES